LLNQFINNKYDRSYYSYNNIVTPASLNPNLFYIENNYSNAAQNLANADAGTTGNYISFKDISCIKNVTPCTNSNYIKVKVANGNIIKSSHIGQIKTPDGATITAHLFPEIETSLLSISEFVDIGYTVIYNSSNVKFNKNNTTMFTGHRDKNTKLWMIDLQLFNKYTLTANPAIQINSIAEFVLYWHACFCFPPKSTFVRALASYLKIPSLSATNVRKYLPNIIYTAFGHLDATRSNIQSTKQIVGSPIPMIKEPFVTWMHVHEQAPKLHSDLTGALPVIGYNKSKYIVIFYCEEKNYIHAIDVTSRQGPVLLAALQKSIQFFAIHGVNTTAMRMDNECSELLKHHLRSFNISLELTPASQHRRNKAERAIRTYKNHFIAANSGIDKDCPSDQWPRFMDQIEITLNLLRKSNNNKVISAYEDLHGKPYDYNKCPIAPLGIKVVAHIPPNERAS